MDNESPPPVQRIPVVLVTTPPPESNAPRELRDSARLKKTDTWRFKSIRHGRDSCRRKGKAKAKEEPELEPEPESEQKAKKPGDDKIIKITEPHNVYSNPHWTKSGLQARIMYRADLQAITPDRYEQFAELLMEELVFILEYRLIYAPFTSAKSDVFDKVKDNMDENLYGYGFTRDERNRKLIDHGVFDIIKNFQRIETAKPYPPGSRENLKSFEENRAATFPFRSNLNAKLGNPDDNEEGKKAKEKLMRSAELARLLVGAGYKPRPGTVGSTFLKAGDYPDPLQYYIDMQAFLEILLCVLLVTCSDLENYEDLVKLTVYNPPGSPRTLLCDGRHLLIVSLLNEGKLGAQKRKRMHLIAIVSRIIMIYLVDVLPMAFFFMTAQQYDQPHWKQPYLFPLKEGGPWTMDNFDTILRRETKLKLRTEVGLYDWRALWENLKDEVGEGYFVQRADRQIRWSKEPPLVDIFFAGDNLATARSRINTDDTNDDDEEDGPRDD